MAGRSGRDGLGDRRGSLDSSSKLAQKKSCLIPFKCSVNPPKIAQNMESVLSPSAGSGHLSPLRNIGSLPDYHKELEHLKKENFSLKLRIYLLEKEMAPHNPNDEVKVNMKFEMELENEIKDKMLDEALRTAKRNEAKYLKTKEQLEELEQKLQAKEEEISSHLQCDANSKKHFDDEIQHELEAKVKELQNVTQVKDLKLQELKNELEKAEATCQNLEKSREWMKITINKLVIQLQRLSDEQNDDRLKSDQQKQANSFEKDYADVKTHANNLEQKLLETEKLLLEKESEIELLRKEDLIKEQTISEKSNAMDQLSHSHKELLSKEEEQTELVKELRKTLSEMNKQCHQLKGEIQKTNERNICLTCKNKKSELNEYTQTVFSQESLTTDRAHDDTTLLKKKILELEMQIQETLLQKSGILKQHNLLQEHLEKLARFMENLIADRSKLNITDDFEASEFLSKFSNCLDKTLQLSYNLTHNISGLDNHDFSLLSDASFSHNPIFESTRHSVFKKPFLPFDESIREAGCDDISQGHTDEVGHDAQLALEDLLKDHLLSDCKKCLQSEQENVRKLVAERDSLNQQLVEEQKKNKSLEILFEQLNLEKEIYEKDNIQSKENLTTINSLCSNLQEELHFTQKKLQEMYDRCSQYDEEVNNLKKENGGLVVKNKSFEDLIRGQTCDITDLRAKISEIDVQLEHERLQNDKLKHDNSENEKLIRQLEEEKSMLECDVERLTDVLSDRENTITGLEREISNLMLKNSSCDDEIHEQKLKFEEERSVLLVSYEQLKCNFKSIDALLKQVETENLIFKDNEHKLQEMLCEEKAVIKVLQNQIQMLMRDNTSEEKCVVENNICFEKHDVECHTVEQDALGNELLNMQMDSISSNVELLQLKDEIVKKSKVIEQLEKEVDNYRVRNENIVELEEGETSRFSNKCLETPGIDDLLEQQRDQFLHQSKSLSNVVQSFSSGHNGASQRRTSSSLIESKKSIQTISAKKDQSIQTIENDVIKKDSEIFSLKTKVSELRQKLHKTAWKKDFCLVTKTMLNNRLSAEVDEKNKIIEKLEADLDFRKKKISLLQKRLNALEEQQKVLESDKSDLCNNIPNCVSETRDIQMQLLELKKQVQERELNQESAEREIDTLKSQLQGKNKKIDFLETAYSKVTSDHSKVEKEIKVLSHSCDDENLVHPEFVQHLDSTSSSKTEAHQNMFAEIQHLTSQLLEMKYILDEKEKLCNDLHTEIENLNCELENLREHSAENKMSIVREKGSETATDLNEIGTQTVPLQLSQEIEQEVADMCQIITAKAEIEEQIALTSKYQQHITVLQDELQDLKCINKNIEEQKIQLQTQIKEQSFIIKSLSEENQVAHKEIIRLRNSESSMDKRQKEIEGKFKELQQELLEKKQYNKKNSSQLEDPQPLLSLTDAHLKEELEKKDDLIDQLKAENKEKSDLLYQFKNTLQEKARHIDQQSFDIKQSLNQICDLEDQLQKSSKLVEELKHDLDIKVQFIEKQKIDLNISEDTIKGLQNDFSEKFQVLSEFYNRHQNCVTPNRKTSGDIEKEKPCETKNPHLESKKLSRPVNSKSYTFGQYETDLVPSRDSVQLTNNVVSTQTSCTEMPCAIETEVVSTIKTEQKIAELQHQLTQSNSELQSIKARNRNFEKQNVKLQEQLSENECVIEKLSKDEQFANTQLSEVKKEIEYLHQNNADLNNNVTRFLNELSTKDLFIKNLSEEKENLKISMNQYEARFNEMELNLENIKTELIVARNKLEEKCFLIDELKHELEKKSDVISQLELDKTEKIVKSDHQLSKMQQKSDDTVDFNKESMLSSSIIEQLESDLNSKKNIIDELTHELHKQTDLINELSVCEEEKTKKNDQIIFDMKQKSNCVLDFEEKLAKASSIIEQLESDLNSKNNIIDELKHELEKKSDLINELRVCEEEKTMKNDQIIFDLKQKSNCVLDLEEELARSSSIIKELRKNLDSAESDIKMLTSELNNKTENGEKLDQELKLKLVLLDECKAKSKSKSKLVIFLKEDIEQKNKTIRFLKTNESENSNVIQQLMQQASQKNQDCEEACKKLAQTEHLLSEKNKTISSLEKKISELDFAFISLPKSSEGSISLDLDKELTQNDSVFQQKEKQLSGDSKDVTLWANRKWSLQKSILQLQVKLFKDTPLPLQQHLCFVDRIASLYATVVPVSMKTTAASSDIPAQERKFLCSLQADVEFLKNVRHLLKYFIIPMVKRTKSESLVNDRNGTEHHGAVVEPCDNSDEEIEKILDVKKPRESNMQLAESVENVRHWKEDRFIFIHNETPDFSSRTSVQHNLSARESTQSAHEFDEPVVPRSNYSSPDLGIESDPNQDPVVHKPPESETFCKQEGKLSFVHQRSHIENEATTCPSQIHVIGILKDFELLRKEVEECLVGMKVISSRANEGLRTLGKNVSPKKLLEYSTLRGILDSCKNLEICLHRAEMLINNFWYGPYPLQEERENFDLVFQENICLKQKLMELITQQKETKSALRDSQLKAEANARHISKQLVETKKVLRKAKTNLENKVNYR